MDNRRRFCCDIAKKNVITLFYTVPEDYANALPQLYLLGYDGENTPFFDWNQVESVVQTDTGENLGNEPFVFQAKSCRDYYFRVTFKEGFYDLSGMLSMGLNFLTSVRIDSFEDISKVTSARNLCYSSFNLGSYSNVYFIFNQPNNIVDMSYAFCASQNATQNILDGYYTKNVTNMEGLFYSSASSNFTIGDTYNLENASKMFYNCLYANNIRWYGDPSKITNVTDMFYQAGSSLSGNKTFYYNSKYDFSKILSELPSTWNSEAITYDGL